MAPTAHALPAFLKPNMTRPRGKSKSDNPCLTYSKIAHKTGLTYNEVKSVFNELVKLLEIEVKVNKRFHIPLVGVIHYVNVAARKCSYILSRKEYAIINRPPLSYPKLSFNPPLRKRLTIYSGDIEILEIRKFKTKK